MAGSYLRPVFVGPLTLLLLTSHTTHFMSSKVFKVKVTFSASFLAHRGLYLNSHSIGKYILSTYPKRRLKFIQPIILFLVQSFGKYQIPRDLTMILLQGIKMSTWAVEKKNLDTPLSWTIGVSFRWKRSSQALSPFYHINLFIGNAPVSSSDCAFPFTTI